MAPRSRARLRHSAGDTGGPADTAPSDRDRDRRPREVKDHGERAAMHPAEKKPRAEPQERAERPERAAREDQPEPRRESRRDERRDERPSQKPTASATPPRGDKPRREREARSDRHPQRDVSDAPDHRGFTEQNMPAFLTRSVKA